MKTLIVKTLNLFALLGAVAWLANDRSWEPAITSIGLLASLLSQEVIPVLRGQTKVHDKELFDKLLVQFPSNGPSLQFLKDHDIGSPFYQDDIIELNNFVTLWDNAEHEFQNKNIEKQRVGLLNLAQQFRKDLSSNIYPHGVDSFTMDINDWEESPEILKKRDNLNQAATKVYEAHQQLVRIGKKCLS